MANDMLKELEDVKPEEDFFEKILNEEIDIETGEVKETDSKTEKTVDDVPSKAEEESVESLKAKIAELEKERKGQLNSVVKSRQERALFKSELSELKSAVASLLEQRDKTQGKDPLTEEEQNPLANTRTKVEFDEKGDEAFVDLAGVKKVIDTENAKTRADIEALKQEKAAEQARINFQRNVESVVNENKDVYVEAYGHLSKIYKDLNDKIIELQTRTGEMGEDGTLPQDVALEIFSGSPEEEEFLKEHPGVDPTRIARAMNSKVDLRYGLKHVAEIQKIGVKSDPEKIIDDKIKAAKDKPGGLAGQGNRNSEETGDLIARLSTLSHTDFENMSDAEIAKIEQMLYREEMKGY